jgi:hypothetical protein
MKALVPGFALLTFIAAAALPIDSHAQTAATGSAPTMTPDTGTAPTSSGKKSRHSSKSHHAKKKTKKPSATQTSSAGLLHHSMSINRQESDHAG